MNTQEALAFAKERLNKISYQLEMSNLLPCRSFYEKQQEMLTKAVPALQEQANRGKENKPLTLEQLREMDGQPVWVHSLMQNPKDDDYYATTPKAAEMLLKTQSIAETHSGIKSFDQELFQ